MGTSGLATELTYFKSSLGTMYLSAYGLGEIGKANLNSTAYGTGGAISVANIYTPAQHVGRCLKTFLCPHPSNPIPD